MQNMKLLTLQFIIAAAISWLTVGAEEQEMPVCLNPEGYSIVPKCEPPMKIKVVSFSYAVNTESCAEGCCVDRDILCNKTIEIPPDIIEVCDGQQECKLEGGSEITAVEITCPTEFQPKSASFARVKYICVNDVTEAPTSQATSTPVTLKEVRTQAPDDKSASTASTHNTGDDVKEPEKGDKSDMGLVIGLSVAGGILIIIIVVVIAVCTTKCGRRQDTSSQSQNSTKTLASSDLEIGDSPEPAQQGADVYGFEKPNQTQQERLQRRNEHIKRNLSFKSDESKNKRPSKLSKSKSKSKSSSLDHLNTNNSNRNASSEESQKAKPALKKKTIPVKKESANPESKKSASKETSATAVPEAKSSTNLLSI